MSEWETIQEFYLKAFGIDKELVELNAVIELMRLCVCGFSNEHISKELLLNDPQYVKDTLKEFMSFDGFEADLDYNPLLIYNRVTYLYQFIIEVTIITNFPGDLEKIYNLCKYYKEKESYLKEKWST